MTKTCTKCGKTALLEEFSFTYKKPGQRKSVCLECTRAKARTYAREHRDERLDYMKTYQKENREAINTYMQGWRDKNRDGVRSYMRTFEKSYRETPEGKERVRKKVAKANARYRALKDKPCLDCGQRFHFAAMDFDHVGTKSFQLARYFSCSEEKLLAEIAGCELVCSNCHRIRTLKRLGGPKVYRTTQLGPYIDSLKASPCLDCGHTYPPECMDFDHRPGETKLRSIGYYRHFTLKYRSELLAEVAKCDLICSNCHRVRTYSRRTARTNS